MRTKLEHEITDLARFQAEELYHLYTIWLSERGLNLRAIGNKISSIERSEQAIEFVEFFRIRGRWLDG